MGAVTNREDNLFARRDGFIRSGRYGPYLTRQNAEKKGVGVVSEVAPGTPVHADRNMVATILRNLLDNAVKFTPGGGQVTIKAVNKNQWVEISVADTGTGMAEYVKDNLFKIDCTVSTPNLTREPHSLSHYPRLSQSPSPHFSPAIYCNAKSARAPL